MTIAMQSFEGSCHCGAISYVFRTAHPPAQWGVRACQCSFCRAHGARTVTDPSGSVIFRIADTAKAKRYRFGTQSSDFLICGDCGVYMGALLASSKGHFATLNINAIRGLADVPAAAPVSYDGESVGQKTSRREQRWTPVVEHSSD